MAAFVRTVWILAATQISNDPKTDSAWSTRRPCSHGLLHHWYSADDGCRL